MALSNRVPDMREPERRPPERPSGRPITGLIWALIALAVLVAIIVWVFKSPSRSTQPNGPTAMQNQVKFSNLKVNQGVLAGTAENLSGTPLTAIYVTAGFTDNSGHVVATAPETVKNAAGSTLAADPIPPGQSHDVQITLNNPPQNWDGTTPQLTITGVDHGTAQPGEGSPAAGPNGGVNEPTGATQGNVSGAQGQAPGNAAGQGTGNGAQNDSGGQAGAPPPR